MIKEAINRIRTAARVLFRGYEFIVFEPDSFRVTDSDSKILFKV